MQCTLRFTEVKREEQGPSNAVGSPPTSRFAIVTFEDDMAADRAVRAGELTMAEGQRVTVGFLPGRPGPGGGGGSGGGW